MRRLVTTHSYYWPIKKVCYYKTVTGVLAHGRSTEEGGRAGFWCVSWVIIGRHYIVLLPSLSGNCIAGFTITSDKAIVSNIAGIMTEIVDVAIIGAGPYGLSIAAHLADAE